MGNKAVRPQPNHLPELLSVADAIREPLILPPETLLLDIDNKRCHSKPRLRCAERRKSRRQSPDQRRQPKSPGITTNYNTTHTRCPYVQPKHVLPMGAQRPRTSSRRKSSRMEHSGNNQMNLTGNRMSATNQDLLTYPFGRLKCRSQMGDLPSVVCNPAQLYRLTDSASAQSRICHPQTKNTPDTSRPETARSRPMSKSAVVSPFKTTSSTTLSHPQIISPTQTSLFEVVPSLKPIAELLQEFNRQCLLLPDTLRHAMDDLLDYNVFLRVKENGVRQRKVVIASIQSSLVLLSELIPLMSQHILNAQDLFHALSRMEEKFQTFQKLVEQLSLWNESCPQTVYKASDCKAPNKS